MKHPLFKHISSLLLFGTNGIVASHIMLSSYNIVFLRSLVGSIFLLTLFFIMKQKFTFYKYKKDLIYIIISGITMGMGWMLLYEGYVQIGVGIASLLYYCGPVIVMALSPIVFKERLTAAKIGGFIAVLCGVFLINGAEADDLNVWGISCSCMAAVTYAAMVISNKKSVHIVGMENSLLQLIVALATVAVFVGFKDGFALEIQSSEWIWILILGLLNTGFGCYLYFATLGYLKVQTVAVCGYLEPLSAVIFGAVLLGERMMPLQILGTVLILGGAIFAEVIGSRKKELKNVQTS